MRPAAACVVEREVEAGEFANGASNHCLDLIWSGDVGLYEDRCAAGVPNRLDGRFALGLAAGGGRLLRPLLRMLRLPRQWLCPCRSSRRLRVRLCR